jgi:serine/threonine protein kinase
MQAFSSSLRAYYKSKRSDLVLSFTLERVPMEQQMETFVADNDGLRTLLIICYLGTAETATSTTASRTLHLRPSVNCAGYLTWDVGTLHKYTADILVVMCGDISDCDCVPLVELTPEDLAKSCFRHAIEFMKLPRSLLEGNPMRQPLHHVTTVLTTLSRENSPAFPTKQLIDDINAEAEGKSSYSMMERDKASITKLCIGPDIWLSPSKPIFSLEHQEMSFDDGYIFDSRDLIHEDGFTEVYKVVLNLRVHKKVVPTVCAIKRFRPRHKRQQAEARRIFLRERQNLIRISKWKHPRIMGMLGSFEVTAILNFKFGHLDLIFPFADGGDLGAFMRLPSLSAVLDIIHPASRESGWTGCNRVIHTEIVGLSEALEFIHGKSQDKTPGFAIHRDIKPSNILIHETRFKFADFGLSKFKSGESTSKTDWWAGTPMYAPPEKKDEEYMHGRARDVWALGCVFLELVIMVDSFRNKDIVSTPAVDVFENERLISSGSEEAAAFAKTLPCVVRWIDRIGSVASGKEFKESTILPVVQTMLEPDPTKRAKADDTTKKLRQFCSTLDAYTFYPQK